MSAIDRPVDRFPFVAVDLEAAGLVAALAVVGVEAAVAERLAAGFGAFLFTTGWGCRTNQNNPREASG